MFSQLQLEVITAIKLENDGASLSLAQRSDHQGKGVAVWPIGEGLVSPVLRMHACMMACL